MNTDNSEAMRLADLFELEPDADSLYRQAAALLRKLPERIAELEAERDQLREEVERLKREKANAIDKAGHMLAAGRAMSNCAFNLKQRVGEPLSTHDVAALESSQRAWDAAIDLARTTHKETE